MFYSFLPFTVILSLQVMYRGKLASTELFTILGGFISSFLFLVSLSEAFGMRTGWGAVILAEVIALITASTVLISQHANAKMLDSLSAFYCMLHEKIFSSLTTWVAIRASLVRSIQFVKINITSYLDSGSFLFSAGLLYEVNKI